MEKEEKKEKKINKINIFLILSCAILIISLGIFGYFYYNNEKLNTELDDLEKNIVKVKEKISTNEEEIEKKESEYAKLKEEVKEKIEELEIWKETKEKLNSALQ